MKVDRAVEILLGELCSDAQRERVIAYLDREGGAARFMEHVLRDERPILRRQAVYALPWIDDPEIPELLRRALRDSSPLVRSEAVLSLARLKLDGACYKLCRCLEDRSYQVRAAAARALEELADPRAIQPLCLALERRSPQDVQADDVLVRAIERCGGASAVRPLLRVFRHAPLEVSQALTRFAAANPTPALADALPLIAHELPPWTFESADRREVHRAAQRAIRAALTKSTSFPIPSTPPHGDAERLPLPSEAGALSTADLPVVTDAD